ncbi:hypothetical protein ASD38_10520 [Caulobacter sp. Root487D2Y]|uniref:tetratricopeptide repeat protein n=1 Tax=Caulobacter sp. Root487D2Y TaxID=1736547 RepID=UPI0006F6040E|nr:tetratricopeptide repeat protein [Caulobacter sp. Root487D2Y]KQY29749.1 hypothetical protein ASD38_10520 [Caulobacter sp. Root487D2Y]
MSRVVVVALAFGLGASTGCVSSARAEDGPAIAPVPAWVKPVEIPNTPQDAADGAPIKIVVLDRQLNFGPDGDASYGESVMRIQTVQGLSAAGILSLSWRPGVDTLVVHKVHILRGGQVIDVLARQAFTVLRRENNLEFAMLDGVLTATLQPEGLQVGDVIDMAFTVTHRDPVLKGHAQEVLSGLSSFDAQRIQVRAIWTKPRPVAWRASRDSASLKSKRLGDTTELTMDLRDVRAERIPADAPDRFKRGRELEFSDFVSWEEASALLSPLFAKASVLQAGSPLKAEVAKIRAASNDPRVQAAAALALTQNQVRYVYLGMNQGALTPADADVTWIRRFGDCKGKTALLLALLGELGVQAEPALVSVGEGDGLETRLPGLASFDHVIARAVIDGKVYWLDGTRMGDGALEDLKVPDYHWALPVRLSGGQLERLTPTPLTEPEGDSSLKLDASGGLDAPAPARAEIVFRGDAAYQLNASMAGLPAAEQDRGMREYWSQQYDFIVPKSVSATYDPKTRTERLILEGEAKMGWYDSDKGGRRYELDGASLGWKVDYKREPGPYADAPFAVAHPIFTRAREEIVLPNGGAGFVIDGADEDRTVGGVKFERRTKIDKGVLTMTADTRSVGPEFPASEAKAVSDGLAALKAVQVYVRAPAGYLPTQKETELLLTHEPTTADAFVDRGSRLLDQREYDRAIADFSSALALDPNNVLAYADRGVAHAWKDEVEAATADFDSALRLDPRSWVAVQGRGILAERRGDYAEAVVAYGRTIDLHSGGTFALLHRARGHRVLGHDDLALADTAEILKISPNNLNAHALRAEIFQARNKPDLAIAEGDAAAAANPDNTSAQVFRAGLLARNGRPAEAEKAYAAALALKPEAWIHLAHAGSRDPNDQAGRLSDILAALKLEPDNVGAGVMHARLMTQMGRHDEAIAELGKLLRKTKDKPPMLLERATAYAKAGRTDAALKDFAAVRVAAVGNGELFNNLCWTQATLNLALDAALGDCDAALRLKPHEGAFIDSRAFVLLRLGRLDEALQAYDEALKLRPGQGASLYGRALTRLRKGMAVEGAADLAEARAVDPKLDQQFADYGLAAPAGGVSRP